MYRPLGQDQSLGAGSAFVLVRSTGDPMRLAPVLERAVSEARKDVAVSEVKPMARLRGDSVAGSRVMARALGSASLLALFLAALGLYGVLTCVVGERTNELGVRLSLGASPEALAALVLRKTAALALVGIGLGLVSALALSRLLEGWLFGVPPHDPSTLGTVAAVLMLVALAAGYGPARRAGRLDPAALLRGE
jgi:ABC-type antimicrobial peptide transport system permease subunit